MQDGVSVKGGGIRGGKELRGGDFSFYESGERILGELGVLGRVEFTVHLFFFVNKRELYIDIHICMCQYKIKSFPPARHNWETRTGGYQKSSVSVTVTVTVTDKKDQNDRLNSGHGRLSYRA
jgi:hypothetical protein